jgi:beta-lactamase regulating signal transducer with metallopeptidase domain
MTASLLRAFGWALLLSFGQGLALAAVFALVQRFAREQVPVLRERLAFAAQILLLVLLFVSAAALWRGWQPAQGELLPRAVPTLTGQSNTAAFASAAVSSRPELVTALGWLDRAALWVALAWVLGVLCAFVVFVQRWRAARRLLRTSVDRTDLTFLLDEIGRGLGIRAPVRAVQAEVAAPAMIGWLHPVVLLPNNVDSVLSREQLRAVLAHELAHVRRHDYAQHIVQCLMNVFFFHHPVARWLNHCVRRAREEACDDLAVQLCRNPVVYARALERLESARASVPGVAAALAVMDGELLGRIRRLVSGSPRHTPLRGSLALVSCALTAALLVACALPVAVAPAVPVAVGRLQNSLWNVDAEDDAGRFTVTVLRGRVLAATIAGRPVPLARLRQTDEQLHFLRADGSTAFTVDVTSTGIHWSPRPPG